MTCATSDLSFINELVVCTNIRKRLHRFILVCQIFKTEAHIISVVSNTAIKTGCCVRNTVQDNRKFRDILNLLKQSNLVLLWFSFDLSLYLSHKADHGDLLLLLPLGRFLVVVR